MEIRKLTVATEEQIKNETEAFFDLGLTSQKAAVLLNYLFTKKLLSCPSKRGYYYSKDGDTVNGGGLLVKGKAQVTINDMNEVGVYFRDRWSIGKYVRVASGRSEIIKSIKDKIGNELKKLWKNHRDEQIIIDVKEYTQMYGTCNENLDIDQNIVTTNDSGRKVIVISLNEYRALYEFLKSREPSKIKERYGAKAFDSMVGHRIEDQFLLSAIDVIKNEIKNVEHECTEICKKAEEDFNESYNKLKKDRDDTKAAAEIAKRGKISDLQSQLKDLLNATFGANPAIAS